MQGERKIFFEADNGGFNNPRMSIDSRKIEKVKLNKERKEKEILLRNRVVTLKKMIESGELDTGREFLLVNEEDLEWDDLLILDKMTPLILSQKEKDKLGIQNEKISSEKLIKTFRSCFKDYSKYKSRLGEYFANKSIEAEGRGIYDYDFSEDSKEQLLAWMGNRLTSAFGTMPKEDRKKVLEGRKN